MLPFAPSRKPRASSTPDAQVSTLKPGGNLNLEVGSLSGAVGIGNAGTGAIFIATSDFGRPLAHPGSSAGFGWGSVGGPVQHSVASTTSERTCFMTCLLGSSASTSQRGDCTAMVTPSSASRATARRSTTVDAVLDQRVVASGPVDRFLQI